jgi:hypothetical protein
MIQCPVCRSTMEVRGENRRDHHCVNRECPAKVEANYTPHLSIRNGWYYCEAYHLPVFLCGRWYAVSGPFVEEDEKKTQLQLLQPRRWVGVDWAGAIIGYWEYGRFHHSDGSITDLVPANLAQWQVEAPIVLSVPYYALPANLDLAAQLTILVDRFLSMEKPMPPCAMCGALHDPEDDCEEADLMRGETDV